MPRALIKPAIIGRIFLLITLTGIWLLSANSLFQLGLGTSSAIQFFAIAFLVQAAAITGFCFQIAHLEFTFKRNLTSTVAAGLIVYAIVILPIWELMADPVSLGTTFWWINSTIIATIGIVLLAATRTMGWLLPIPVSWCALGTSALANGDSSYNLSLIVAGAIGLDHLVRQYSRLRQPGPIF